MDRKEEHRRTSDKDRKTLQAIEALVFGRVSLLAIMMINITILLFFFLFFFFGDPKKNTSHENEVLQQDATHLI